jgi:hypothetical protein
MMAARWMHMTREQTLILFVLGIAIGWGIAHCYALRASRELRLIGRAFAEIAENAKLVEWKRDRKGRITFYKILRSSDADPALPPLQASGEGKTTPKPGK